MPILRLWLVKANHHPIVQAKVRPRREEDQGLVKVKRKLQRPQMSTAQEVNQPPTNPPQRPRQPRRRIQRRPQAKATTITTTR